MIVVQHVLLDGERRCEIIVMTREEIRKLGNTNDLVLLLKRELAQLAASGTIFEL